MLILAIDTALEACAVAILDTGAGRLRVHEQQAMARGHAEALMPMIDRTMRAAELSFMALDRIAVTVGPGSFTGLRVGISAARGLGLAAEKPVVGVTTLSAYAAPHLTESGDPIVSLIDARHDRVYMQVVAGDGAALVRPRLAAAGEIAAIVPAGSPCLVGNAARMVADRWPADAAPPASVEQLAAPDIAWVAWLGAAADPATARPRPLYLRAVDAQPQAAPAPGEAELSASP
jgi:tRNA threonylcarbamoyladenosine biosynthesis protein TsaB